MEGKNWRVIGKDKNLELCWKVEEEIIKKKEIRRDKNGYDDWDMDRGYSDRIIW